jgi:DNA polymerase III epsilon subunit-like protein
MMEFPIRMDRSRISFGTAEKHDKEDRRYWQNATCEEKLMTITYLRECFYGPKATTVRIQRFYKVLKRKIRNKKATGRHRDLDDAEILEKGEAEKKGGKKKTQRRAG